MLSLLGLSDMKKIFTIIIMLTVFTANGKTKYIEGEGSFHVQEGDSFKLANAQLKYSAFKDIITKSLSANGFDAEFFWFKYNEKFNEFFKPTEENMRERFAKNKEPSQEQYEQFYKSMRTRKLIAKAKFGRLERVIKSYTEKKRRQDEQNFKIKYLEISATVDGRLLNRLYLNITEKKKSEPDKIYITAKVELQKLVWTELGLEQEKDFTSVVMSHWKSWLEKHLKNFKGEFLIADEDIAQGILTYMNAPIIFNNTSLESGQKHYTGSRFADTLWLHINISIKKISDNIRLQERNFQIGGGFILTNLGNKKIVHHGDFEQKTGKYSTQEPIKLSSALANAVWKMPLSGFKSIPGKMALLPRSIGRVKLEVQNIPNISELIKFTEVLSKRGLSKQFRPNILSYSGTKGTIQLEYRSSFNDMVSTLTSLNNTLTGGNSSISLLSHENPFFFALKEVKSSMDAKKAMNRNG